MFNQRESYKWFERAHSLTCQLNLRSIRYKIKNFHDSPESCWTIKGSKTQHLHFSYFSLAFHAVNPKFKVKALLSRASLASVIFPRHEIEKGRELSWAAHEISCPPCISSSALCCECAPETLWKPSKELIPFYCSTFKVDAKLQRSLRQTNCAHLSSNRKLQCAWRCIQLGFIFLYIYEQI